MSKEFKQLGDEILERIGLETENYFATGSGLPLRDRLTRRTSNLIRSLQGGAGSTDRTSMEGGRLVLYKGTQIPYARLHELGGEIPVQDGHRLFFFAKYYQNRGVNRVEARKWYLIGRFATVLRYPPRPFLRPAIESPKIEDFIRERTGEVIKLIAERVIK